MTVHQMIARLEAAKLFFTLSTVRDGAVMFQVSVPGQRWEIEVFEDGHVEFETFKANGEIGGEAEACALIAEFAEP